VSSTVSFVIHQISFAHLDAVHGAHFGTHGCHEQAIAEARSQNAFVQLASQRAREARVTYARICTYTRKYHFNNNYCIYGPPCGSATRCGLRHPAALWVPRWKN